MISFRSSAVSVLVFLHTVLIPWASVDSENVPQTAPREKSLEMFLPDSENRDPWEHSPLEFQDPDFLGDFSEDNSKSLVLKAREDLSRALDVFQKTWEETDRKRKEEEARNLDSERYDWQRRMRLENLERSLNRELAKSRQESVTLLAAASRNLDKVKSPKVRKTRNYLETQAGVYRELIKHQYAMKNYVQSAEFLEKYLDLDPSFGEETEPHRLLAFCYERLALAAKKSRDETDMERYLSLKRKHGILYAKLKYGSDSYEFKRMVQLLAKD
ncbi:hypothetical protein EHO61_00095 [Leptospira fluminis]|uniref:Tetratricopeptide repeat protein n=1 Tax=Leptospira fluminis TaxID=2484979 RepID=A0A4R9GTF7_9LEPT|nr:hypothetical protein [Leptospira fluminis]TGK22224.1 hypothetical protein EHO61_00095 [Leptospira fluminis]